MEIEIIVTRFDKLFKCSICLLLLSLLTISPIYAGSGFEGDNIDVIIQKIKMHLQIENSDPEIDEQLRQLEWEMRNGMPTTECCTHCHAEKRFNP